MKTKTTMKRSSVKVVIFLAMLLLNSPFVFGQCTLEASYSSPIIVCGPCPWTIPAPAVINGAGPYTYLWSNGITIPSWQVCDTLPYTITVTDMNGCSDSAIVWVEEGQLQISYQVTPSTCQGYCDGEVVWTCSGNACALPLQYFIDGGPSLIGGYSGMLCEGGHAIQIIDANGCVGTSNITVSPASCACDSTNEACEKVCEGNITTFTAPPHIGSTYQWTVTGQQSYIANNNTVDVIWADDSINGGLGTIQYIEFLSNGETDSVFHCYKVVDSPYATFTTAPAAVGGVVSICSGTNVSFINQSTDNAYNYWDFGNGSTSTSSDPNYTFNQTGTFTVLYAATNDCKCLSFDSIKVNVVHSPGPDIQCASVVCAGDTVTYNTSMVCNNYNWSVTGGTILSQLPYSSAIVVAWGNGSTGPGTVTLNVGTCTGLCVTPTTISIPIAASSATISGDTRVCTYVNAVTYSVPNLPGTTFNWTVNGGNILSGQGSNSIRVEWPVIGTFTVSVSYNFDLLGCGGSGSLTVNVSDLLIISNVAQYCLGDSVAELNTTTNNYNGNYLWRITTPAGITTTYTSPSPFMYPFATTGHYLFTTIPVTAGALCTDSVSGTFDVIKVSIPTGISGDTVICPGSIYAYEAQSLPSNVDYAWSVIGGTLSSNTGKEVSVTWNATGPYSLYVKQKMLQWPYCESDSISITAIPYVLPGITGPVNVCPNGQSIYSINGPTQPGTYYEWSVTSSLGSVISGQGTNTIRIEWFNNTGIASLTVNAVNCNNQSATLNNIIVASPNPPVITPSQPSFCTGSTVILAGPNAASYLWADSSGIVISQLPTAIISKGGFYSLTIHDTVGCAADTLIYVDQKPAPTASISTPDANVFCIPLPVSATVSALTAAGYSYQWFLNTGPAPGSGNNPVYNVTQAGAYTVLVTNAQGCSKLSNSLTFYQDSCNVTGNCTIVDNIDFTTSTCDPIQFTGSITGGVSGSAHWIFDDTNSPSNTANGLNASHDFSSSGYYHVTFYSNAINTTPPPDSCTIAKTHVVTVYANADFKVVKGCKGSPTMFTDLSTYLPGYPITSWLWDFGDLTTSPQQNPMHIYTAAGTYTVTLTVVTSACIVTATQQISISGINSAFTFAPTPVCVGTPVSFTDGTLAQNQIISWNWNYGDGTGSDNQNPNKSFISSGHNTVVLLVKDNEGCSSSDSIVVNVNSLPAQGIITPGGPISMCGNASIALTAPAGIQWQWTSNDTSQVLNVNAAGDYAVVVTTSDNCVYLTPEVIVNVTPLPVADISGPSQICQGKFEYLTAYDKPGQTLQWLDVSTMTVISTSTILYLNALTASTYNFILVASAAGNSCDDTSDVFTLEVLPNPTTPVLTTIPSGIICGGDPVDISVSNPQTNITYSWSEGSSSFYGGGTAPGITVVQAGDYVVTATNDLGCSATSAAVTIHPPPDFSDVLSGCYEFCDTTNVTVYSPQGFANYQWIEMINGTWVFVSSSTTLTLSHSGVYALVLTSFTGCTDTSQVLVVNQFHCCNLTAIVQGSLLNCFNENNGTATVTSPTGGGVSYLWSTGQATASVSGLSQGDYYVRVSTAPTCQDIATVRIQSPSQMPVPIVLSSGDSVFTNITDTTFDFQWINNGTPITNANGLFYLNADSGCYQLQLTDYNGCVSISDTSCLVTGIFTIPHQSKSVTIYPNPFSHSLTLVSNENGPLYFTLYDVTGRLVMQNTFVQKAVMETSSLRSAVYFYDVRDKGKIMHRGKLLKE